MVIILELSLMGQDKLKVILTPFDMIKYDLTCDKIDYDNTETRKAVWSILDYAKHETGFDAATGRIYIQVYPEKNGALGRLFFFTVNFRTGRQFFCFR